MKPGRCPSACLPQKRASPPCCPTVGCQCPHLLPCPIFASKWIRRMNEADPSRHPKCSIRRPCLLEDPHRTQAPPPLQMSLPRPQGPRAASPGELQRALVVSSFGTDSDEAFFGGGGGCLWYCGEWSSDTVSTFPVLTFHCVLPSAVSP